MKEQSNVISFFHPVNYIMYIPERKYPIQVLRLPRSLFFLSVNHEEVSPSGITEPGEATSENEKRKINNIPNHSLHCKQK